jgi:hypothetical protein
MRVMLVDGESVMFQRRGNMWTPERSNWCGKYFVRLTVVIGAIKIRRVTSVAHNIVREV